MKHFLCTRFNLKHDDWQTDREGVDVLSQEWLTQRLDLFSKYCIPSVLNQNNKNFRWVILFDVNTPSDIRDKINTYSNNSTDFTALYIDGMNSLVNELRNYIINNISIEDKYVITTRLDNDDAIHENFISTIQELANEKDEMVIDLIKGYQMNVSKNHYEYRNHFKYFNPFISVVESSKKINTVYFKQHFEWSKSNYIKSYNSHPLWIEIIHSKNKSNSIRKKNYLKRNLNLIEFGIIKELDDIEKTSLYLNNLKLAIRKLITKVGLSN